MADYFCLFSFAFDVGTAANAARACAIYRDPPHGVLDEPGRTAFSFDLSPSNDNASTLILSSHEGSPDDAIAFIIHCATAFSLRGLFGFAWADTCSKARLDAFGGGAVLIDLGEAKEVDAIATHIWLDQRLRPH